MNIYELVEKRFMDDLAKSSEHTQKLRQRYCQMFLEFAKDKEDSLSGWNKGLVNEFIEERVTGQYSGGTPRAIYNIVKRVFDAAKMVYEQERLAAIRAVDPHDPSAIASLIQSISTPGPQWQMTRKDTPKVENQLRPVMALENIKAIVRAAKEGKLTPAETVFSALDSVYGL